MPIKRISLLLLAVALAFCFCTGKDMIKPKPDMIDKYISDHPDLPVTDKDCLEDGRFEIGILQETLLFLLGEPKTKEFVKQPWATQEKWTYQRKGEKVFIIEDKHVVGILEKK
jgi:hypothetical protein